MSAQWRASQLENGVQRLAYVLFLVSTRKVTQRVVTRLLDWEEGVTLAKPAYFGLGI
jgi:hypothetical protein